MHTKYQAAAAGPASRRGLVYFGIYMHTYIYIYIYMYIFMFVYICSWIFCILLVCVWYGWIARASFLLLSRCPTSCFFVDWTTLGKYSTTHSTPVDPIIAGIGSMLYSDFHLSGGCFGTDIIQKCTKRFQIGVHGLTIWPIFAKFQCASFLI